MTKVRFAPSPTGHLHVGNARAAIANYLYARRQGGKFLLRIDDTDAERSRPEYTEAIEHDLTWLGITWDESFHQSQRLELYAEAADKLRASGRLYPCFESEDELRFKRDLRLKQGKPPVYDRAMLRLTAEQRAQAEANGKRPYWRFKLSDTTVTWIDRVLGQRLVKLTAVSDPVLIRADGTPLYTFTSVVDDIATEITDVIRGEDHITNTGIQIDIFGALGFNPSRLGFSHLPLLTDSDGGKLSKRLDSLTLRSLRGDGVEPAAIVSYLARLGSSEDPEPLGMEALASSFDFGKFSKSSARFDVSQLLAMNRRILHEASFADVVDRLPTGATEVFWLAVRGNLDLLNEARGWWDVVAGDIVSPLIEGEGEYFKAALEALPAEPWDKMVWPNWIDALKAATGRTGKKLFMPLRLALTGEDHGPELRDLLPLIGRARAAERLRMAAA